jgi:adenylate cyclase class IV
MSEPYLEVELRYKVHDVPGVLGRLSGQGISVARTEHLIDEWFLPEHIQSLKDEQQWFDVDRGIAWRIRRTEKDGKSTLGVESKQLTEDMNHNSFLETTADFATYDDALQAMNDRQYKNWLTIDKTRYILASSHPDITQDEFELVIDDIAGLAAKIGVGACLEIEHKGTSTREEALRKIARVAVLLGFTADDQIEKSLTVLSMTALARFD